MARNHVGAHHRRDQRQSLRLAEPFHWEQYRIAWIDSNFATYFWNSTLVVVGAVAAVTLIGAAAAHALARYRFRGNRLIYGILFSSIIFPPQITLISLYQILVEYNLYNSLFGLMLVYVSLQLPLTVYLLEGFFARIPQDLFDAAKIDGYGDWRFSGASCCRWVCQPSRRRSS